MNHNSILSVCPDKISRDQRHALLAAEDYEVVSVASMAEALRLLETRTIGVILLDAHFAKDEANRSLLQGKGRVLSLKFPLAPALLLNAISSLVFSPRRTNRWVTAAAGI
jgi:CheY-like chemotaxis protein